jgi:hypothetical protein
MSKKLSVKIYVVELKLCHFNTTLIIESTDKMQLLKKYFSPEEKKYP